MIFMPFTLHTYVCISMNGQKQEEESFKYCHIFIICCFFAQHKMICRLCLDEHNDFVQLFDKNATDDDETELDIVQIIHEYLHLELKLCDPVSTSICKSCWRQLHDFNQFCLMVNRKQDSLLIKAEATEWFATNVATTDDLDVFVDVSIKDETLCEPIIDAKLFSANVGMSGDSLDDVNAVDSTPAHEICEEDVPQTRSRTKKIKADIKKKLVQAQSPTKRKYTKRLQKANKPTTEQTTLTEEATEQRKAKDAEIDKYLSENVKLECDICKVPLPDFLSLKRHFRSVHQCAGYAICCNTRFDKRSILVNHIQLHKDPNCFSCSICKKKLRRSSCLRLHMIRFHSDEELLTYQCPVCEKKFPKNYLLTKHIKSHNPDRERTEQCEFCQKSFHNQYKLKAHVQRMHDDTSIIICDICGAHFRTKHNFTEHKRTRHGIGPQLPEVQCQICLRWLRDENSLRKHMYLHRDLAQPGAFKCNQCGEVKATPTKLREHVRYHHHHESRYNCTMCEKKFKGSVALNEHLATHTGIDLYACPFCTRTFKSHANMHNHKRKMHPDQWVRKYTVPCRSSTTTISAEPGLDLEMGAFKNGDLGRISNDC